MTNVKKIDESAKKFQFCGYFRWVSPMCLKIFVKNVWKEPQKAQYYVGNIRKTEYTKMAQTFITILYIYYVKQFWKNY